MPELCRFLGIIIRMYFNDIKQHNKPHFHVEYGEYKAEIGIDGEVLSGNIPNKQLKIIQAWCVIHEEELYKAWNNAVQNKHFDKIKPLN